jgi:hypothetical protein
MMQLEETIALDFDIFSNSELQKVPAWHYVYENVRVSFASKPVADSARKKDVSACSKDCLLSVPDNSELSVQD